MNRQKKTGFTLIEIIIVVAIVAILASIALPSYQETVRKSRRSEAITTLLDIQLREEKWRVNNSTYGSLADIGGVSSSDYYNFSVTDPPEINTYTITATAKADTDQVNDKEEGTTCSPLTLDQSGVKSPEVCWR